MKRILVTGANGFVGRHVVSELAGKADVVPLARDNWDITKPVTSQIRKKIGSIDTVIHLAGLTAKSKTDAGMDRAKEYFLHNVVGTINVLDLPVKHFIFVSTADVYGYPSQAITEQTPVNPQTAYAASKLAAEHMVRIFCLQKNIPFCVARLANVYGPGEDSYEKAIPSFIRQAIAGKPLSMHGKGASQRDYIYVTDVAKALGILVKKKCTGIYNVASGISISINEVAKEINNLTENAAGCEYTQDKGKITHITFDNSKLTSIGFKQKVSLVEGLKKEIHLCKSFLI